MMSARANQVIAVAESSGSSQRALRPRAPAADQILVSPFANGVDMEYSGKDAHHLQMFLHHIKENKSNLLNMLNWSVPSGFQEGSLNKLRKIMKELSKRCHQLKMSSTSDIPPTAIFQLWNQANCDATMIEVIMDLVYKLSISDVSVLVNKKKRHETYGEVMPAQLAQFRDRLNMGPSDVFLDLGSGIGNTVCYFAGACEIEKAVGIELLKAPAEYAKKVKANFEEVMAFHGKKSSPIELIRGNFLDSELENIILNATVIYTNNCLFEEDVNIKLEAIFMKSDKKPKIISSKSFVGERKTNSKYQDGLRGATKQEVFEGFPNNTSWTGQPVKFFLLEFKESENIPAANEPVIAHNVIDEEEEDEKENEIEDLEEIKMDGEDENEENQDDDQQEVDIDFDYRNDEPLFDDLDYMEPLPIDDLEPDRNGPQMENGDENDDMEIPEAAGDDDDEENEEDEEDEARQPTPPPPVPVLPPRFHDGVVGGLRSRQPKEVFQVAIAEGVKRFRRY